VIEAENADDIARSQRRLTCMMAITRHDQIETERQMRQPLATLDVW
jgi:hypothetical protein